MVYLDNNATTAVNQNIVDYITDLLTNKFANASALYPAGIESKRIIENSRLQIKSMLKADFKDDIVFTSCASESNNAVFSSVTRCFPEKKHIIVSAVEHLSVLNTVNYYQANGYDVSYIKVDSDGNIDIEQFKREIRADTLLVSIMLANNETGVIFPIKELVNVLRTYNSEAFFHTDAVQAIGKIPVDVSDLGVDFMSISGHKFHAPKGIGALFVKNGIDFCPFIMGGHQEHGLRAGTENIAYIGALGMASLAVPQMLREYKKREKMRDWMEKCISELGDVEIIGTAVKRLPNTSNISAKNISGDSLMFELANKGFMVATGSACNSSCSEPSHVLKAMGIPEEFLNSIRVSLSEKTTANDLKQFIECYSKLIKKRR